MNKVEFQQTGGFPLETDTLDFLQSALTLLQVMTSYGGNNCILSGCVNTAGNVSDGFVVINNELLPFRGGLLQTKVVVREEVTNRSFENGSNKGVFKDRFATFGTGDDYILFSNLFRTKDLKTITQEIAGKAIAADLAALTTEVNTLKKIAKPFSAGGGMVLFKKPLADIPEGWAEVVNWRGRLPMGWNPDDPDFDVLNENGGTKGTVMRLEHLIEHDHNFQETGGNTGVGDGENYGIGSYKMRKFDRTTAKTGSAAPTPIEHLNPYRVVMFIEYIG